MIRISGVILSTKKHIYISLMEIFGVGKSRSLYICNEAKISPSLKVSDLTGDDIVNIQNIIGNFEVEGDLRRRISMNIKRLKDIKCYRGMRHRMNLPVRGQRTKTNSKTRKVKKRKMKLKNKQIRTRHK